MHAKERLYITADKMRLVAEGDPAGAFLYAAPGDTIPDSAVEMFGLIDGGLAAIGAQERRGGQEKQRKSGEDKSRRDGEDKDRPQDEGGEDKGYGNDLTEIVGIGAKTARALAAAGIDSFAKLAAVDPASPPALAGINPRAPWADWAEAARARTQPAAGGLTINELPKGD